MDAIFQKLRQIWKTKSLRNQILFTIYMLILFRLLAHVTIPGADIQAIHQLMDQKSQGVLGIFSLLTGGAMENFSVILMGLTPYINASIIMQLLTVIVPSLENLKKEGEIGQKKINQYTRFLTVPLAFVQSYGMMLLINRFSTGASPIIPDTSFSYMLPMMLTVTAGTMLIMWIGELISEKGIGNGISVLIFAGIVATVPQQVAGAFQSATPPIIAILIIATVLLTIFVIYVAEADRRVPVVYASRKSTAQQKSFLPLKINQAGMIPIIFAVSMLSMPSILSQFFIKSESAGLQAFAEFTLKWLNPNSPTVWYNLLYSALIFGFTFFYVSIVFEPKKVAENIQKRGGFVPGYRPGTETETFFGGVINRLCFWGGAFLAFVAVVPMFFEKWVSGGTGSISLFISGAGMIIVVSVVLDLIRRINSQLVMHDYAKL